MTGCSSDDARACAEALDALHEYLDGELAPGRLASIAPHIDACRRCGLEAEAYRALKEALRRAGNGVDPAVLDRLRTFARRLTHPGEHHLFSGLVAPHPRPFQHTTRCHQSRAARRPRWTR